MYLSNYIKSIENSIVELGVYEIEKKVMIYSQSGIIKLSKKWRSDDMRHQLNFICFKYWVVSHTSFEPIPYDSVWECLQDLQYKII